MNNEFAIPELERAAAAPGFIRETALPARPKTSPAEDEQIAEILRIGQELEALRSKKIGEKRVRFLKSTTRSAR